MKKHAFHFVNGFFAVVTGVIGLASVITTGYVISASPRGVSQPVFNKQSTQVTHTTGYVRKMSAAWNTTKTKNMGYAVLADTAKTIKLTADVNAGGGAKEFSFVTAVTEFGDTPVGTFSLQNKALKSAAGDAQNWGASNTTVVTVTPDMQGKWLTIYSFVRDNNGVTGAAGLPNEIDDVAAIVFQMPKVLKNEAAVNPAALNPLSVELVPSWTGVGNPHYPVKVDQVVTYVRVSSNHDKPVELHKINLQLATNSPFNGSVAIIKMPKGGYLPNVSQLASGDPANDFTSSTIGLGVMSAKGGSAGCPCIADVSFPMAKNVVIQPKSTMILGITADNVPNMVYSGNESPHLAFAVKGIAWREQGSKSDAVLSEAAALAIPPVKFTPVSLSAVLEAASPGGASSVSSESVVAKFVITNKNNPANAYAAVDGIKLKLTTTGKLPVYNCIGKVYKGQYPMGEPLGTFCTYSEDELMVYFPQPLMIEAGSSQTATITLNTTWLKSNDELQLNLIGLSVADDAAAKLPLDGVTAKGKKLVY